MRRNQSPHSPLIWSVTILLTWATFVSVSDSKTITCQVPPVMEGQLVVLTCDYGEKMYTDNSGKPIIVEHHFENKSEERIVDCFWKNGASSYTCLPGSAGNLKVQSGIAEGTRRYVTVEFPAKKAREGTYYCKTTGLGGIISTPCSLTIMELTTCKLPTVEEGQQATLTCDYGEKNSLKRFSVDHYFDDGSSEQILDCSQDGASSYTCQKNNAEFQMYTENNRLYVKVRFHASKNKEGIYYCKTPGMTSAPCSFAAEEGCTQWKNAVIILVIVILCLLIAGAIIFCIRYIMWHKQVVVSNAIESLICIVCLMKLQKEKLEPERVDDAETLVTTAGTGFEAEVTADLHRVMLALWNDPKLQDFVQREAKDLQLDSGVYFLDTLKRMFAHRYIPTKEDKDKAWVKVPDASKTSFNIQVFYQRFLRQRNSTAEGAAPDLASETDHPLPGSEKAPRA